MGSNEADAAVAEPLFIDFTGRPVSMRINGTAARPDHRDHRLWLEPEHLEAVNRIELEYRNSFDATGDGFHRFVDLMGVHRVHRHRRRHERHRVVRDGGGVRTDVRRYDHVAG